ncbi:MAG: hypothetical protein V1794_04805 [Candidatus Glassbacteria bacterium]
MNLTVGFRTVFGRPENGRAVLRLAGGSLYRVYLNGRFVLYGPARAAHGYYRLDEVDLSNFLQPGGNLLAVEAAGYNVNSYYLLDEPAFLQAEVISGDRAIAATGRESDFTSAIPGERVQMVPRYSFQRTFTEVWRLAPGSGLWRTDPAGAFEAVQLAVQPEKKLIPRRVPYPEFTVRRPYWQLAAGRLEPGPAPEKPWYDRAVSGIGPDYKGYPLDRLEANPTLEVQKLRTVSRSPVNLPLHSGSGLEMEGPSWRLVDFAANLTGMVGLEVEAADSSTLYLTFDEVLTGEQDVDFSRLGCSNVIALELAPGGYRFESFEPYTLRYLKLNLARGRLTVKDLYLREYANPQAGRASFEAGDRRLVRLFEAGRETFRQNAVDLFTDCPSRERAGWLCDSYFTARAGFDLTGGVDIEKAFLENFVLPDSFARLPAGMLPMCYPADHTRGTFIPNWALWFVLELEEYLARSGDRELVEAARPKVSALFDYFARFANRDGLLEGLESWVFIEWSAANQFTQDVSYPSNFLYAAALEAAGRLYGLRELTERGENVRRTAGRRAFDGEFFVDNAERTLGWLHNTKNRTEVNQYFAFYFEAAAPESRPELWRRLVEVFGPRRDRPASLQQCTRRRHLSARCCGWRCCRAAACAGKS